MKISFRSPKSVTPDRERGIRLPYAPAKRAVARWRWYLVVALVTTPLLLLFARIFYSIFIVTASGLITLEKVPINAQIAGWVKGIVTRPGEQVTPGQLLAVMASSELEQREELLQAEQQARQSASVGPSYGSVLRELEYSVKLAQQVADYYAGYVKDLRFLFNKGAATVADLKLAESQKHQAELSLQQMRISLASRQLEEQRNRLPTQEYETRMELIRAELEALAGQKSRLVYTSPVRGRVLELHAEMGQSISQGQPLLTLGNLDAISVTVYLDPRHIRYARPGQRATVKLGDGRQFAAVVRKAPEMTVRIPAPVTPALGEREFMLLVLLDPLDPLLPSDLVDNLPVTVRFPFSL